MSKLRQGKWPAAIALSAMLTAQAATPTAFADRGHDEDGVATTTPIKHVIVLIGENRSFDHVDSQVHRAQLGNQSVDRAQPRQPAQSDGVGGQSLRPDQPSGDRRPDGHV